MPNIITRPYTLAVVPENLSSEDELNAYMIDVVRQEGPIQHELLFNRLRVAARYSRAGRNVRAWLDNLIEAGVHRGEFTVIDGAYLIDKTSIDKPRNWTQRPEAERKIDYLPNIEIAVALRHIVKSAFGIDPAEAVREAFKLIGFRRITNDALDRGRSILDTMIQSGEFVQQNGLIRAE